MTRFSSASLPNNHVHPITLAITTSDDDLSKGHAEYLEARLIEQTDRAGRVVLDNVTKPDTTRRRLPEADVANMEQFLANLHVILPVVGLGMLKPQPRAIRQTDFDVEERTTRDVRFEIRHKSGVRATAVEEDGEFIVLEGSQALTGTGYVQQSYGGLKERLIGQGVLVPCLSAAGGHMLRFARPWPFSSPSAAAAIVLDRNSNGRLEWKVRGATQTYHDWQQTRAARPEINP